MLLGKRLSTDVPFLVLVLASLALAPLKIFTENRAKRILQRSLELPPLLAGYHARSLARYHFGYPQTIAAFLWVKLLQDHSHKKITSDRVSWEYTQVDSIVTLDPNFDLAYQFGGVLLQVLRQDKTGAKLILEKWRKRRPIYWKPAFYLGQLLYYEFEEYDKAALLFKEAASFGNAPDFTSALAVRLASEGGELVPALVLAVEVWEGVQNSPEGKERLIGRIRSLRYEIERRAWQTSLEDYRRQHQSEPNTTEDLAASVEHKQRDIASTISHEALTDELSALLEEKFRFRYFPKERKIDSIPNARELNIDPVGIYHPKKK